MALTKSGQTVHRAGPLKQSNKPHKSGRSKDKKHDKGKSSAKAISRRKKHELSRIERRNKLNQLRKAKRDEVINQKRSFGGTHSPPVLAVLLPLDFSIDVPKFLNDLKTCDEEIITVTSDLGHHHISFPRQKQRFTFVVPEKYDIHSVMDVLKVADVLILIHSLNDIDEYTDILLSVIIAHSLPTTIHVIQGLEKMNPKAKAECRKHVLKAMESRFPEAKLHQVDTKQEFQYLLRQIGSQKQLAVGFRDCRFHLLGERVQYIESDSDIGKGTLKVSGYIRDSPLNVNSLVHISGWGNFQMSQIDYESDPYPLIRRKNKIKAENEEEMLSDDIVLCDKANSSLQESLQSEVIPDPMEGEQTWPTKEELDEVKLQPKKKVKKVAEGTSDYQASWIIDSEDDSSEVSEDQDSDDAMSEQSADVDSNVNDMESIADISESVADGDENLNIGDENYDKNIDMDEEKKMLVRFKEERMNEIFPDEMDTPVDISARIRFQKYRGLKNFSSAPWDAFENLPPDYARIYRFENFKQTKKKVMNAEREGAQPGLYITMHISNVPQSLYESVKEENSPLVVYGLLPHEQKMSVVNVVIRKHFTCKSSIKSKDPLIFHIGYHRFMCRPIFSEHKTGNKFKYERFLPRDVAVVASFYAPVMFPPASVVVFKQHQDGSHELVATGSVLDVNPNRVVVKRIVLSGHPFKILKRTAIVRYMFFNKEDIKWFKCVELHTKCGRRGHIRESLGSHGHMKCVFDKQLQSQDVVLMNLYKRIFPKWTYDCYVPTPTGIFASNDNEIK